MTTVPAQAAIQATDRAMRAGRLAPPPAPGSAPSAAYQLCVPPIWRLIAGAGFFRWPARGAADCLPNCAGAGEHGPARAWNSQLGQVRRP